MDRILGRTVVDLAGEVDAALGRLASAQHQEAQARESLSQAQAMVAQARHDVAEARDALFAEHPDLAPEGWTMHDRKHEDPRDRIPLPDEAIANPGAWDPTPVEVDDANDSRYTGGVSTIPTGDDEPLPPIEWEEHDG